MTKRRSNSRKGAAAGPLTGIVDVIVRGFKSLGGDEDHRIAIRPLTLLAGANSSGKSSAIQPLLLLKQTLESGFDPGPLRLHDTHVRFTRPEQIVWRTPGGDAVEELRVGLVLEGLRQLVSTFRLEPGQRGKATSGFELARTQYEDSVESLDLTPSSPGRIAFRPTRSSSTGSNAATTV